MQKIILSFFLLITGVVSQAQDKSNRGKEFWLAYGFDYSFFWETPVNNQELALYISTEQAASVTVSITNTGWTQTLNIPANTVDASILIPKSGANDARTLTDGLNNRGIHIVSDVPVAVYAHVYSTMVSGATMLMPVETYGYSYYSINYYQTTSQSSPADWYSWFYAIATEDNTRLEITPSDTTKNGWLPGQTYTVNLNKGESYHVFGKALFDNNPANASKDMTGSKIISVAGADGNCHPVAVFSGSGGIRLCRGDGGEFVHQQVFPAQAWGTRYLTYHTINNTNTDILETNRNYYRVCVTDPATVVKKNGVVMTGLINNFYYEYMDSTGGDYINSDKPILVSQYTPNKNQCWNFPTTTPAPPSYGDPEMFYLSPIEQGQKSVLYYVSRKSSIDYVYVNIHVPTAGIASLRVDGVAVPSSQIIPHPNYPGYSVALARHIGAAAQHRITCDSAFTATVYGLGNYESYGYNVGTLINNLNNYSAIANVNNTNGQVDTFTCPNTPVRLYVKIAYPALSIHWKLSQVPGISPNVDSIINNPVPVGTELINGRTYYVYTLQQDFIFSNTGVFYLPVSYTAAVIQNCNQTENASVKIEVKPGPFADFTWSNALCAQDTVHFTGTSVPGNFTLSGYNWLFDDNSTVSTVNASKRFITGGNHPVRYRIIADNGCTSDTIKTVALNPSPVANFGVTNSTCLGSSVYITDTSVISPGSITEWHWDFGNVENEVRFNNTPFSHLYFTAGTYIISLNVISTQGCSSDTFRKTITILPKPVSKFGFDRNVCLGQSIVFSDSSSASSGTITQWKWDFGDGNTDIRTDNLPFGHTYATAGNFTVTLVVSGSNGCNDTSRLTVNVSTKPSAEFTISGKACIDSTQQFVSSFPFNASMPSAWYWDFGDGQSISINSTNIAAHAYSNAGSNIVIRHAVASGGCVSDTVNHVIPVINVNPAADFNIAGSVFCEDVPVSFTGTGSADITNWLWDFGNGAGTDIPPFIRTYANAGNYNVTLIAQTAAGCGSVPVIKPVNIAAKPDIDAGPDIIKQPGDTRVINAGISNASAYDFLWTPSAYLNTDNILRPSTTAPVTTVYTIRATDRVNGCVAYDSVAVKVITEIFVPNAFTPNNDGINDRWRIPALEFYPGAYVAVYDRYGIKLFEGTGNISWDGTYKGKPQPAGTYVYFIRPTDNDIQNIKGTVMIIR